MHRAYCNTLRLVLPSLLGLSVPATCDAPNYGAIDIPLDRTEHRFIEQSIKALGVDDASAAANKATKARLPKGSRLWIVRIDDPRLCIDQECLTFLIEGQSNATWTVSVMTYAGQHLGASEPTETFGSGLVFSSSRGSGHGNVTAWKTGLGWIIR